MTAKKVFCAIAGLVALSSCGLMGVPSGDQQAKRSTAQADLSSLAQALDQYRLTNNRYPTAQEGLAVLAPQHVRRVPTDPWNNAYSYAIPGPNGAPFGLASLGADGREGGSGENADITN